MCNCLGLQENACRSLQDWQLDLPTDIFSENFHRKISQIWHFSMAFGSKNYRLALSGEKHLATLFRTSSKNSK